MQHLHIFNIDSHRVQSVASIVHRYLRVIKQVESLYCWVCFNWITYNICISSTSIVIEFRVLLVLFIVTYESAASRVIIGHYWLLFHVGNDSIKFSVISYRVNVQRYSYRFQLDWLTMGLLLVRAGLDIIQGRNRVECCLWHYLTCGFVIWQIELELFN